MSILGKLKYILLLIIITYSYLMKILDKLISLELAIGSSLSQKANLIFSFLFALIFIGVALSIENKTYICIFAGMLLFWQRYIILKLRNKDLNELC
jgi:hypothetical protein